MFLLDETGRFLYTKYGKSEEGVQTLGEKIIHGIHRFLEILEIVLAAVIVLVLVALMGIEIWELARDSSIFLAEGFLDSFLSSITSLVVAVEFVKNAAAADRRQHAGAAHHGAVALCGAEPS